MVFQGVQVTCAGERVEHADCGVLAKLGFVMQLVGGDIAADSEQAAERVEGLGSGVGGTRRDIGLLHMVIS